MLSSKTAMMLTAIGFAVMNLSYSQKTIPDSIYHRNEISVNVAPALSALTTGTAYETVISVGYAHNFGRNHFLRTGVKIIPDIRRSDENTIDDYMRERMYNFAPNGNATILYDSLDANHYSMRELKASIYLGYDHLVGKRKFKFLLGIEAMIGFNNYSATRSTYQYNVTHTPDTVNNVYQSSFDYKGNTLTSVRNIGLHVGFTPRLGMRCDVSRRIAFTVVYAPLFYFDLAPYQYVTPLNNPALKLYGIFIADASFIVKL